MLDFTKTEYEVIGDPPVSGSIQDIEIAVELYEIRVG